MNIKLLAPGDESVFAKVLPNVFDHDIVDRFAREFLTDVRHHLAVAIDDGWVVGIASAVHYVHPDKQPELWINEVCVAPAYQKRGIGKSLLSLLFKAGREVGCVEAWVLTDHSNMAAQRLYSSFSTKPPKEQAMFTFSLDQGNAP